ncbi:MAG: hypothetical protein SF052_02545 [Bacteroidia bacterium]|nr:hypothetical protein [Bacteroidia bacterium]
MKKISWRQVMYIHLYLGLFCMPYLLIFGLSSLDFNHHFFPTQTEKKPLLPIRSVHMPLLEDDRILGEALRDSLGLFGWYLPWETKRDSLVFITTIAQPGKEYHLKLSLSNGEVEITETYKTAGQILRSLHFMGESIPSAPWWVNLWQYYQVLTVYSMLFWTVSGVYLWWRKKNSHPAERWVLLGMGVFSIGFILFVWLAG